MKNILNDEIINKRSYILDIRKKKTNDCDFRSHIINISKLQNKYGSFDLINETNISNDMVIDYCDHITYICTSLYIESYIFDREWFLNNIGLKSLKKALFSCSKKKLFGHSYDGLGFQLSNMIQFIEHGLNKLIMEKNVICYKFNNMINEIIISYYRMLINNNFNYGFGYYKNEIMEVLNSYEK